MRKILTVIILLFICFGCASMLYIGTKYKYSYKLTDASNREMTWSDKTINISFSITNAEIVFFITNLSSESIKIIWDEASISKFGFGQKIMHKGVKYSERTGFQLPTTIPPNVSIEEFVLPVDNVYWREGYYGRYGSMPGRWERYDLLPTDDMNKENFKNTILSSKGQKIILYLPIESAGIKKTYSFTFEVIDVSPIQKI